MKRTLTALLLALLLVVGLGALVPASAHEQPCPPNEGGGAFNGWVLVSIDPPPSQDRNDNGLVCQMFLTPPNGEFTSVTIDDHTH
jgi:hypothetical protein